MSKIKEFLQGKKTYLLALALFAYSIGGYASGNLTAEQAIKAVYESSVIAALRAGIENSIKKTE